MTSKPKPPPAFAIVKAFTERWHHLTAFVDWGEPACFACGYFQQRWDCYVPWDERTQGLTPLSVLNDRWERARLQKAHLVGRQFDGDNEPGNFALLCPRCHRDAPDVPVAEVMARWIIRREGFDAGLWREFAAACPPSLVARWVKAGEPTPDNASAMNRGGQHFDPDVGPYMSYATLAAVGVEAFEAVLSREVPGQLRLL